MKNFILFFGAVIFFTACNNDPKEKNTVVNDKNEDTVKPAASVNKDSLLSFTGKEILSLLKNKQYDRLTGYFSDSVHFSPYGFIGSGRQTLTAAAFKQLMASGKKINWGSYDGSGDPIDLTLQQYVEKFVYNADFLNAEISAVDSFIKTGNSLNNLKKVYPDSRFIEYHFPGFDKKYDGMDWTSLRLVFKENNGRYALIAIVHDQWTI